MTSKECVDKMRDVLKKTNYGWMVVSDDPDCECDFGVDANGNIVVCGGSTFFKLSDLESITYYDDKEMDVDKAFIHFSFNEKSHIYLYYNDTITLGDEISVYIMGHEIDSTVSKKILHSYQRLWDFDGDFLIGKDGTLLCYIGEDVELNLPCSIKRIGEYAFYSAKTVERIVCSEMLKEICSGAFLGLNNLKSIDLQNVEIIGENAFRGRKLEKITIPCTVRQIGKEAFYWCGKELVDNITNNSSVVIDDTILKYNK